MINSAPLIQLHAVSKFYPGGDSPLVALLDIDLTINAGEMVAIMGPSGSGKTTLMNILGCLDRPTEGAYFFEGKSVGETTGDELARLRRENFGFIFQHYQLLPDLDGMENVGTPAVYTGLNRETRRNRARALLQQLGMQDRMSHGPSQLSGGQQQRVSIARALMNGGQIILADEPTGALDSESGAEVLQVLRELNLQGHTIILITHDAEVARHARRIVQMSDGCITRDVLNEKFQDQIENQTLSENFSEKIASQPLPREAWTMKECIFVALLLALSSLHFHRSRTVLAMLSISIGIASVVCVVAIGDGAKQKVLRMLDQLNPITVVDIHSGARAGDLSIKPRPLDVADLRALQDQYYVKSATPVLFYSGTIQYLNVTANGTVKGVGEEYFNISGLRLVAGNWFDQSSMDFLSQDAVMDVESKKSLSSVDEIIGKSIFIDGTPFRVIGIFAYRFPTLRSSKLEILLPYTSAMARLTGNYEIPQITVRIADDVSSVDSLGRITSLLIGRRGGMDFTVVSSDALKKLSVNATETMNLMVSGVALISLIVGGIGVMNIMLASVTERSREIGIRMAVGARQNDIRAQFLLESFLICLSGGAIGIAIALVARWLIQQLTPVQGGAASIDMAFSFKSIVVSFLSASAVGIISGFMPARRAAALNPVDALASK